MLTPAASASSWTPNAKLRYLPSRMPSSAETTAITCSAAPLRAAGGEHDGGAGDEADPPRDEADLVVADLHDQAPDDAADERCDESCRDRGEEGARRLRQGRRRLGRIGKRIAVLRFTHGVRLHLITASRSASAASGGSPLQCVPRSVAAGLLQPLPRRRECPSGRACRRHNGTARAAAAGPRARRAEARSIHPRRRAPARRGSARRASSARRRCRNSRRRSGAACPGTVPKRGSLSAETSIGPLQRARDRRSGEGRKQLAQAAFGAGLRGHVVEDPGADAVAEPEPARAAAHQHAPVWRRAEVVEEHAPVDDRLAPRPADLLEQLRHRLGEDDGAPEVRLAAAERPARAPHVQGEHDLARPDAAARGLQPSGLDAR